MYKSSGSKHFSRFKKKGIKKLIRKKSPKKNRILKSVIIIPRKFKSILKRIFIFISETRSALGDKRECYICGKRLDFFMPYRSGFKSEFVKKFDIVGGRIDNFWCIYCRSHSRERHLFMFFDKLGLWEQFQNKKMLHIAPEKNIREEIEKLKLAKYILGDLNPLSKDVEKIDITNIKYPDNYFDFIICNHVLEHVVDDTEALNEISRVLVSGGRAVLQTPFSPVIEHTFENSNFNTDKLRLEYYGQEDHVRIYGKDFFAKIENAGFDLQITKNNNHFSMEDCDYYGVEYNEDLILVKKR